MTEQPHRKYEVSVTISADTWEDAVRELGHVFRHVRAHGPECRSVSGGCATGHIVSVRHDPEMDGDIYRARLEEHLARLEADHE